MTVLLCFLSVWVGITGFITAFSKKFRNSILALWLSSMGLGVMYLVLGSEILAITQWFFSTTTTLLILVYSLVMGDWLEESPAPTHWRAWILPICGALSFAGIIAIGLHDFEQWTLDISREPISATHFGAQLLSHHPLVLFVLGFETLLTIVCAGVISRADWIQNGEKST